MLLGNGFSQAYNADIFSYKNLLEKADLGSDKEAIVSAFNKLNTADFELVIRALDRSRNIGKLFLDDEHVESYSRRLIRAKRTVKAALWHAISSLHPESAHDVDVEKYEITRKSLIHFKRIYTVNYDLLLYWTLTRDNWYRTWGACDGFGMSQEKLCWQSKNRHKQNVFWLHGGLHMIELENGSIQKLKYRFGESMMEQIHQKFSKNEFPVLVAEGTSKRKQARITRNVYLADSYRQFSEQEGCLLTYGFNFNPSDSHIVSALSKGMYNKIYVALYGKIDSTHNNKIRGKLTEIYNNRKAMGSGKELKIKVFPSHQISFWSKTPAGRLPFKSKKKSSHAGGA